MITSAGLAETVSPGRLDGRTLPHHIALRVAEDLGRIDADVVKQTGEVVDSSCACASWGRSPPVRPRSVRTTGSNISLLTISPSRAAGEARSTTMKATRGPAEFPWREASMHNPIA